MGWIVSIDVLSNGGIVSVMVLEFVIAEKGYCDT